MLYAHRPDLIILDARMPEMDGWETLRRIRDLSLTPVIMLTALDTDEALVRGLNEGANDFVTKPFSPAVLVARAQAALRNAEKGAPSLATQLQLDGGRVILDRAAAQVLVDGSPVALTPTEFRVFRLLADHLGQVLSARQILERVWGDDYTTETEYVKTYIRRLRAKIEPNPRRPRYLVSRRSLGYLLQDPHTATIPED